MNIEEQGAANRRVIGLISDTHGLVRPGVHSVFAGAAMILHAGDVGEGVLAELRTIAPVFAVLGNTDPPGDPDLPPSRVIKVDGITIHVSHGHEVGSPKPEKLAAAHSESVIVYGHTHRQLICRIGESLVVNPGAAGARRFNLKPSVALLAITNGTASAQIIELDE